MAKAKIRAAELMRAHLPGSVRLTLHLYDGEHRQYRPVPGRHVRVAVDDVTQATALWAKVVQSVQAEVATWPPVGDAVGAELVVVTEN